MRDRGVSIIGDYTAEIAHNHRGGVRSSVTSANQAMLSARLDLDNLAGIGRTTARMTVTYRHGPSLAERAGFTNLDPIQEIFGRGRIGRLTEIWIESRPTENVTAKIGRMPASDFAAFPCDFQNLALCGPQPGHALADYWLVWPVSQWGAWVRYGNERNGYLQGGAYQVTPANLDRDPVEIGSLTKATGVLLPLEAAIFPDVGARRLAGSYKVGTWYDTSDTPDVFLNRDRRPITIAGGEGLRRPGRYGAYLTFIQEVVRLPSPQTGPGRGLSVFLNAIQADRATATIDRELAAGVLWKGPLRQRSGDLLGIGFATTRINPRIARGQRLVDASTAQRSERVLEVFYSARLDPGITFQPGLQYVADPGALSAQRDIVASTLKIRVQF